MIHGRLTMNRDHLYNKNVQQNAETYDNWLKEVSGNMHKDVPNDMKSWSNGHGSWSFDHASCAFVGSRRSLYFELSACLLLHAPQQRAPARV